MNAYIDCFNPDMLQRECFTVFKEGENYKSGIISLMTWSRFPEEREKVFYKMKREGREEEKREKWSSSSFTMLSI